MTVAVIFGGAGFIGSHFSSYLLDEGLYERVYIADIEALQLNRTTEKYKEYVNNGQIVYLESDVRNAITIEILEDVSLIANFAAIHREPGHEAREYFETNLTGAENICAWAEKVNCSGIIFTSSIAPYGPSESELDESTIPVPVSSYGSSKLVAEKIHEAWRNKDITRNRLVIVRPGVVFGAGEFGNVSRLIKAVLGRYFFYMGNKETRKAGVYVKELCHAMYWVFETRTKETTFARFNMTMNPGPTIVQYVEAICEVAGVKRFVLNVPSVILYTLSIVIDPLARLFKLQQPISPVRIKKLVRSNNIHPAYLVKEGYDYKYTLKSAMDDWKKDKRSEW